MMLRISAIVGLSFVALGGASAGTVLPVDLAGVTLPGGDVSALVSTCDNSATAINQVCTASTPTANTYQNALFSTYIKQGAPTPSNSNQNLTVAANGSSATTPFLLAPASGNNYYSDGGAQTDAQMVVDLGGYNPVSNASAGVYSVDAVYTMIQGDLVTSGDQGITVKLSGLNSSSVSTSYTFVLTAGTDFRGNTSGQTVTSDVAGSSSTGTLASQQVSATDSNPGGGTGCNGGTGCSIIVSNNAFGGYRSANSTDYFLDVQELVLPSVGNPFANGGLLQSITISSDAFGTGNTSQNASILIGGISLDQTPEPATVGLFGVGIGFIAFRTRRSRTNA